MKNLLYLLLIGILCQCQLPSSFSEASPEEVGLNPEFIHSIDTAMQKYIDNKQLAGITTMLVKDGKLIQQNAYGWADVENQKPLTTESIFRIYSMTKSITSMALMKLYEKGLFELDDPVSKYIPEFANTKVFKGYENGQPVLVDQNPVLTIRNLMTHSSGLTYGWAPNSYVDSIYRADSILVWNELLEPKIKRLAEVPLKFQPGEKWEYSVSIDVIGYLIEVLSGQKLDVFLANNIFTPLKMNDTGFAVPEEKTNRYTCVYAPDSTNGIKLIESIDDSRFTKPAVLLMGGGGLQSTMMDYARFCQMILNKGELDGIRIFQPETIAMLYENQMPDGKKAWNNTGWTIGFKLQLVDDPEGSYPYAGEIAWEGAADTHFWIDVKNNLFGFTFTQMMPGNTTAFYRDYRKIVYEALQ
nr:serine hydrolase domain-containing protein [uncultured Carboxylicivirga sp.]